ncbi:MFS transporter [Candidatus Bathyarchaeota archaeon]|nr:MFS transporter [Candidatus Bathyarchaeota archaeon]
MITEAIKRQFSFITGNYRVLVVSWIIMDLATEMPTPNFQYYVQALGGTGLELGIIGLANFLCLALVAFPGGYLADKYGRRQLITTMTFGLALSFLLFAFAGSWHLVLVGTIMNSLCLIYQPALFAMVQDSVPVERRGMGSTIMQLIYGVFNTPGPIIAGFLLLQFGLITSMNHLRANDAALSNRSSLAATTDRNNEQGRADQAKVCSIIVSKSYQREHTRLEDSSAFNQLVAYWTNYGNVQLCSDSGHQRCLCPRRPSYTSGTVVDHLHSSALDNDFSLRANRFDD